MNEHAARPVIPPSNQKEKGLNKGHKDEHKTISYSSHHQAELVGEGIEWILGTTTTTILFGTKILKSLKRNGKRVLIKS